MKKICEYKNGKVSGTGVVVWKDREKQIPIISEEMSLLF